MAAFTHFHGGAMQINVYFLGTRLRPCHLCGKKNFVKMKRILTLLLPAVCTFALSSCETALKDSPAPVPPADELCSMQGVARMLAALPIGEEQLAEVYNAVSSSSANGYDEEYMLCDLLSSPGAGVGDDPDTRSAAKARYSLPLRDMISDYLASYIATKAGEKDVQEYLDELSASGIQIYWPYSEEWDGKQVPLITFNPGYGAESNYDMDNSVLIDEELASKRPVWVVNTNDDSDFTPMQLFITKGIGGCRASSTAHLPGGTSSHISPTDDSSSSVSPSASSSSPVSPAGNSANSNGESPELHNLYMKDFTMHRHYDTWFAGASEFFIKCGALSLIPASNIDDIQSYIPQVTDLMVVVKRRQKGKKVPFNALLLSGFTDELKQIALLIIESDGGTRTSWKCQAKVMIKSRSYGIDVDLPFHSQDDIVWRGPISLDYLRKCGSDTGHFGDVDITFEVD